MTTQTEALKLALEALEECRRDPRLKYEHPTYDKAITAIKEALQSNEQVEPVAWITQGGKGWLRWHKSYDDNKDSVPLYTTPPQRTWVALDPEEIRKTNHHMVDGAYHYSFKQGAEWAEARLKERNI